MKLRWMLRSSFATLGGHRVRSLLTVSGVAVAIAAMVVISAAQEGAGAELSRALGAMGARLLVVRPGATLKSPARPEISGPVTTLTREDADALTSLTAVRAVAPVCEGPRQLHWGPHVVRTNVMGTTEEFFAIRRYARARGRLLADEDALARRVVLGARLSRNLFGDDNPVGVEIALGNALFTVIGVLTAKGPTADGADADNQAFIPLATAERRVFNRRYLSSIFVGVHDTADTGRVERELRDLLSDRHAGARADRADDFVVQDQARVVSAQSQTKGWFLLLATGLTVVALILGGTGVLALMWLAVRERTPEIGLRMAIGARPRDIFVQFIAEAAALSLIGGVVGLGGGLAATLGMAVLSGWPFLLSAQTVAVALATTLGLGLAFGAVPAVRAAQIPPVRALALG
jgi:putative ABC transport system permease protein